MNGNLLHTACTVEGWNVGAPAGTGDPERQDSNPRVDGISFNG
jgi:hypothetical protein